MVIRFLCPLQGHGFKLLPVPGPIPSHRSNLLKPAVVFSYSGSLHIVVRGSTKEQRNDKSSGKRILTRFISAKLALIKLL